MSKHKKATTQDMQVEYITSRSKKMVFFELKTHFKKIFLGYF